jgi:predicted Zn-dependent peptidase
MSGALVPIIALTLLGGTWGCSGGTTTAGEVLPGRSRPLLEHQWPHPRDLRLAATSFERPDDRAALVTTASGVRGYVLSDADERVVQIVAAAPFGRMSEQPGEAGAAELLSRLVAAQIQERLGPDPGARMQVEQDPDLTRVMLTCLSDAWPKGLAAVIGGLRDVRIDATSTGAFRTGPGFARTTRNLGGAAFRPAVELAGMTAAWPIAPPAADLTVSPEAIRALAARTLRPDTVVLGIGGGFARTEAERSLQTATEGWRVAPVTATAVQPVAVPARPARFRAIEEPGFTTWIAVGHAVGMIDPADEAAVAVMTDVVNIRLNIAIREIRGLANQAVLQVPATTHPGLLHVRSGARPESVAPVVHFALQELSKIREATGLPTDDELEQVKGGLVLGRWQGSLDGPRAAVATYAVEAARHGTLERLARWPDVVRAVTASAVQTAAAKYIQPDRMATVMIGQVDAARKARHPRWPITFDELQARFGSPRSQARR